MVIWDEVVYAKDIRGRCVKMCLCVYDCKLDTGTWKMKVNGMATQSYFCPPIYLSVSHSHFWIPLTPSSSLNFTPPFFSSSCHLCPLAPSPIYLIHLLPHKPSQTTPSSVTFKDKSHFHHLLLSQLYPAGITALLDKKKKWLLHFGCQNIVVVFSKKSFF